MYLLSPQIRKESSITVSTWNEKQQDLDDLSKQQPERPYKK